ncbi:hypothetical protein ABTE85_23440, partial [Acinetobacter baumannii]
MKKILVAFSIMLSVVSIQSQTIQVLTEGTKTSIRGLNVVNDNIFWASGSSGKVAKSTDGGKTIQ